jgi:ERCC4-type nuclease
MSNDIPPADFLIAPSEPPIIKTLGRVSSVPERHGADILWYDRATRAVIGVQRKEYHDLLGSVADGRLAREVKQLKSTKVAHLIVEGRPRFTPDGHCTEQYLTRWTRAAYRSLLRSVQGRGIFVEHSDSTADTVSLVEEIYRWTAKGDHVSLDRRPTPTGNNWGQLTDKDWACHMLQSIDGIGPKQATAIWMHFGGKLPIELTATRAQLLTVPGVGPIVADKITKAFGAKKVGGKK